MNGVFDKEELQPDGHRRDVELTFGPKKLLMIAGGLALLCGFCFGLGYLMGHRGSKASLSAISQMGGDASTQTMGTTPKPSAAPQGVLPQQHAKAAPPPPDASDSTADADAQNSDAPLPIGSNSASQAQLAQGQMPTSRHSSSALMVQIATVSQQEDADVLVGALRRRGYPVTARRDPGDGTIHVQIGPFTSRGEANRWRQKLLNSGYNAIVQQ
jgi:DedD protein